MLKKYAKKRGIGILKVKGKGLVKPCEEVLRPAPSVKIDLLESIIQEIRTSFESFEGFDRNDFSYFMDNAGWKKERVRKKFVKLIEEIEKAKSHKASFKDHEIRMQMLSKRYAGLNIFSGTKHTQVSHYSIGLGQNFFSVFIQIPTARLVELFLKQLESKKKEFLSLIGKIPDCDIEIYSRTSKAKHGRPMPGGTIYNKVLDMKTRSITIQFLSELIDLIKRTRYPAINFSVEYNLGATKYVIERNDTLNFIFNSMNLLKPVYDFIPK